MSRNRVRVVVAGVLAAASVAVTAPSAQALICHRYIIRHTNTIVIVCL